jgi:thiamine kinase-like enzyme
MKFLKDFHNKDLRINHEFNIFEEINYYEKLVNKKGRNYRDYSKIKERIFSLKNYINKNIERKVLTHIDAVPDNFLIYKNKNKEEIRLIDFEYSAVADPDIDIAMFSIYSGYNKKQIDHLIDIYYENKCPDSIRIKIYSYIAVSSLLWSNWCRYKISLGEKLGSYPKKQYKYAKKYSKLAKRKIKNSE